eukprot:gene9006-10564_t
MTNTDRYSDKVILEVGSGVGICGLFLARLMKRCVLSDHNEIVVDLLRTNVAESVAAGYDCSCIKLDWEIEADMDNAIAVNNGPFDMIIGSDVVYWQTSIIPLFNTVSRLLSHKPDATFILCYQSRSSQTDKYLIDTSVAAGFSHESVPLADFLRSSDSPDAPNYSNTSMTIQDEGLLSIMRLLIFKRSNPSL